MDVSQTATPVLQIGLEAEGHFSRALVALAHPPAQHLEPALRALLPLRESAIGQLGGQSGVAGEVTNAEQRRRSVQIGMRQRERLSDGAHAVTEDETLVPHRVPDAISDRGDVRASVVEQHDIDVALRTQLASSVPADRDERKAVRRHASRGVLQQFGQPAVDEIAVRPAPIPTGQRGVGQQPRPLEFHGSTLGRSRWSL